MFGEEVKRKAAGAEAVLADMNDEAVYGPELHRLGFGDAVEADLLTDYKVVVLAVDETYVAENFQTAMATSGEIALGDAAKLLGCWKGLGKGFVDPAERAADPAPMRRAVAFAKDIKASKQASASFPVLVHRAIDGNPGDRPDDDVTMDLTHPRQSHIHRVRTDSRGRLDWGGPRSEPPAFSTPLTP